MTNDSTLKVDEFEYLVDETKTYIGLRLRVDNGYSNTLDSLTIPLAADDALTVGAALIAYSDYVAGRPVRDWSSLR